MKQEDERKRENKWEKSELAMRNISEKSHGEVSVVLNSFKGKKVIHLVQTKYSLFKYFRERRKKEND